MKLAVIPARGGSKRIPRKNIRPFRGKPIIAWSIEAARQSGCFDRIVVSTDDEEIAALAREFGAEVPFLRPAELSDDHTPTIPVVRHAIGWTSEHWESPEMVCCLYPTAPLLRPIDLHRGLVALQEDREADFAFSVTTYAFPIFRSLKRDERGRVTMFWPEHELIRSQDLPEAWHDAGQFYWGRVTAWQDRDRIFGAKACGVPIPRSRVQDIDSEEDWMHAELMFEALGRCGDE